MNVGTEGSAAGLSNSVPGETDELKALGCVKFVVEAQWPIKAY